MMERPELQTGLGIVSAEGVLALAEGVRTWMSRDHLSERDGGEQTCRAVDAAHQLPCCKAHGPRDPAPLLMLLVMCVATGCATEGQLAALGFLCPFPLAGKWRQPDGLGPGPGTTYRGGRSHHQRGPWVSSHFLAVLGEGASQLV